MSLYIPQLFVCEIKGHEIKTNLISQIKSKYWSPNFKNLIIPNLIKNSKKSNFKFKPEMKTIKNKKKKHHNSNHFFL